MIGRPAGTVGAVLAGLLIVACSSDAGPPASVEADDGPDPVTEAATPQVAATFPGARPGDIVGLVADDDRRVVSWVHRTDGTIHELALDDPEAAPVRLTGLDVSTESQQGGLLDQALLPSGDRALTWTQPGSNDLVLGILDGDDVVAGPDVVWSAGRAGNGAIGGTMAVADGALLVAVGRNTAWDAETLLDGAVLRFELDGGGGIAAVDEPPILSSGYTNPWAVGVVDGPAGEEIWVWDNAAGPDPDEPEVEDAERIGRADLVADRQDMTRSTVPDRAPAALVELPGGFIGVCGFLDNELVAYRAVDGTAGARSELERADDERANRVAPCTTGAAVFDDGTIVTAGQTADGEALFVVRP